MERTGRSQFQSTLPSRGATTRTGYTRRRPWHFNPRSPRGERRQHAPLITKPSNFNPRSPRGERRAHRKESCCHSYFNPRSPRGERRFDRHSIITRFTISIHAPLAGSDVEGSKPSAEHFIFQSTLPSRGATCYGSLHSTYLHKFQSTLPSRGATFWYPYFPFCLYISIHAPLAGSDQQFFAHARRIQDFNPRSPRGERLSTLSGMSISPNFNPRSPRGERPVW